MKKLQHKNLQIKCEVVEETTDPVKAYLKLIDNMIRQNTTSEKTENEKNETNYLTNNSFDNNTESNHHVFGDNAETGENEDVSINMTQDTSQYADEIVDDDYNYIDDDHRYFNIPKDFSYEDILIGDSFENKGNLNFVGDNEYSDLDYEIEEESNDDIDKMFNAAFPELYKDLVITKQIPKKLKLNKVKKPNIKKVRVNVKKRFVRKNDDKETTTSTSVTKPTTSSTFTTSTTTKRTRRKNKTRSSSSSILIQPSTISTTSKTTTSSSTTTSSTTATTTATTTTRIRSSTTTKSSTSTVQVQTSLQIQTNKEVEENDDAELLNSIIEDAELVRQHLSLQTTLDYPKFINVEMKEVDDPLIQTSSGLLCGSVKKSSRGNNSDCFVMSYGPFLLS